MLEAESGWGKTRLVQEFYKLLAEGQSEPGYWPPSIIGAAGANMVMLDSGDRDPSLRRKLIYPQVVKPPLDALPQYLWLGMSAQQSTTGAFLSVLDFELRQLDLHRDALVQAIAPSLPKRLQQMWRQGRQKEFWEAVAGDLTSLAAGGVGAGLLPIGVLAFLAKTALGGGKRQDQSSKSAVAIADELARDIGVFANADSGVPVIIAVEDLQWADAGLIHLITEMVGSQTGPVFVIATAVAGELTLEQIASFEERIAASRRSRVDLTREVGVLSREESLALVAELLEGVTAHQRELLVDKYQNPYVLEIVCADGRVRDLARAGRLSEQAIRRLPSRVKDFWRRSFESLAPQIQEAFELAVLSSPASISDSFSSSQPRWDGDLPGEAMGDLTWAAPLRPLLPDALDDQAASRAWYRRRDTWVRFFHERGKFEVVRELALERFGADADDKSSEYWATLARWIDPADPSIDEARRLFRAEVLVSVTMKGVLPWSDKALASADMLIAASLSSEDAQSLRFIVSLADAVQDASIERRAARHVRAAQCLQRLGRPEEAITRLEGLIAELVAEFGDRSEQTFSARLQLGDAQMGAGRGQDAYNTLAALLTDEAASLDAEDERLLTARGYLAEAAGQCERFREAAHLYQGVIDQRRLSQGDEDPDTIHDRTALIRWLVEVDAPSALTHARALLEHCEAIFPELTWSTVQARGTLAGCLAEIGELEESLSLRRQVAAETGALFGDGHRLTLVAQWELGHALRDSNPEESVGVYRAVCAGLARLLGIEHPDTLWVRHHLTYVLTLSGRMTEAFDEAQSLLSDCEQNLGPESQLTITTRELLEALRALIGDRDDHLRRLERRETE